jgi:processive 1,2-diacylglycerol beta-glucosyltransferase
VKSPEAKNATLEGPILILTIANGAGHIRVAEGLASAIRAAQPTSPVMVVDVADYMTRLTHFTHVAAYLWLVKHAPSIWDRIDRYQKKQNHTSPEWYYRRGCNRLFQLARRVRPRALIATEVGCCEIAALLKRDLGLDVPLVAVNDDYDTDRAWVQPEVNLYCFVMEQLGQELVSKGAPNDRVVIWGASLSEGFEVPLQREQQREEVCNWLSLDPALPLVLIAGGGEGMGLIEETTKRLLNLKQPAPQLVVLTGRNERLRSRCERYAQNGAGERLRVLGWTGPDQMPKLMSAADLMVSKLGSMFNEAIASDLPIIALEPPPGSERVQYRLLEEWKVGCAVRTLDEAVERVESLLAQPYLLDEMREQTRAHCRRFATARIADWLKEALDAQSSNRVQEDNEAKHYSLWASSQTYRTADID